MSRQSSSFTATAEFLFNRQHKPWRCFMFARTVSCVALAFAFTVSLLPQSSPAYNTNGESKKLVVHEWGTFTTVSTVDGTAQFWSPLLGPSELPNFVYRSARATDIQQRQCVKCGLALARMETPVIYFYTDRKTDMSVKVDFPQGQITEWYPQARLDNRTIRWENFTVQPNAPERFPTDQSPSHYYPARETDAAPIQVKTEQEKFLFYRGLGDVKLPLSVKMAGGKVIVNNTGQEMAQVVVFENRAGRIGWRSQESLNGEAVMERPAFDQAPGQPLDSLRCAIESALVAQGLYPKEAAAMVKTWRESWFEEGLRVFYILPRTATDAVLPITITPAPTKLVRVMVGRAEILTPEMEQAILTAVRQFGEGTAESRAAAVAAIRRYGRFAEPVLRRAASRPPSGATSSSVTNLMAAALLK
jgi:hypothetical protein